MPSATLTLHNRAGANVVYTLVGQTSNGAEYKDATRSLALPRTLSFQFILGTPGSLGNDKIVVTFRDTVQNATTGKVVTASAKLEMSAPRDSAMTETFLQDILCEAAHLLVDANVDLIVDGLVP